MRREQDLLHRMQEPPVCQEITGRHGLHLYRSVSYPELGRTSPTGKITILLDREDLNSISGLVGPFYLTMTERVNPRV